MVGAIVCCITSSRTMLPPSGSSLLQCWHGSVGAITSSIYGHVFIPRSPWRFRIGFQVSSRRSEDGDENYTENLQFLALLFPSLETPTLFSFEPGKHLKMAPSVCDRGLTKSLSDSVGKDRAPFAFTGFGSTFYVITKAKHAAEVDKNLETLSFDEFVQDFIRATGVSKEAIKACSFDKLPSMVAGIPNPGCGNIGDLTRLMHAT